MLATLLVALVAIIHLAILVLEMFLWEAPAGRRAFNLSAGGTGGYLFPGLRAGRRDFRRADRQPQNSLYSGAARAAGAGCRADASVGP